ncbi:RNA-dependent RNA polymerase 1 [Cladobotryum mycophilum]|uniref:RNA-dependent RNA polymerase n=1 Tax=Cladobotryum mycophilum TaxID=491253 RepID=A0ABR0T404_9HYPO
MTPFKQTRRQTPTSQRAVKPTPKSKQNNKAADSRSDVSINSSKALPTWRNWPEVSIRLDSLPLDTTTQNLWEWFSSQGNIVWMDVFDPNNATKTLSARLAFEPPPKRSFWESGFVVVQHSDKLKHPDGLKIRATLGRDAPQGWWTSKVSPDRKYPIKITAGARALDWGAMTGPTTMNIRKSLATSPGANDIKLEVEVKAKHLNVYFSVVGKENKNRRFKFVTDMSQIGTVFYSSLDNRQDILVLPLSLPPQYFWKNDDVVNSFSARNTYWSSRDTWNRATDIAYDYYAPLRYPVAVHNDIPDPGYMEIGRWTTFRLCLKSETDSERLSIQYLKMALEDFNIKLQVSSDFTITRSKNTMWDHLNHPPIIGRGSASALMQLHVSSFIHLDFSVRYQLEVCVTRNILNEHTISAEFIENLAALDPVDATRRLEFLMDRNEVLYDPMGLFALPEAQHYLPHARIPSYCTLVRKANITPTTIRFNSPTVETSNRVMRKYRHVQDRFLRVQFIGESENGRIAINNRQNDEIWKRLLRTLYQGIRIGDRTYEFLAFGSSQLRQCGVYFFCPTDHISCDDIRQWMGEFNHIKVIAKYAARLGQCFSTTREMRGMPVPIIKSIPDIKRNGHCFTDGVGIISGFLSQLVMEEMTLDFFNEPSAFQFRMGGCKGVLAVWPHAKGQEVYIRDSQEKFKADSNNLEIIRCAKFASATLNRQTITILECLGVPIKAFEDLLDHQIYLYEKAMNNNTAAVDMLTKCIDENQSTLVLAEFLQAGFKTDTLQEPFVMNLLNLWRSWSLKLLKEKARIQIEKSAFVLGCVDETGTLRGHSNKTEGSKVKDVNKLPQIFLQLSDPKRYDETTIIRGVCIVGRNPSLHPGDIRVVQAVDNPKLKHLRDVVVFPSVGDRPVPSMLSGGDLDGDDFFVIWDPNLIPTEWNHPAMNYTGPEPRELDRDVNVDDLRDFFVNYLKNDVLPLIATSHLAFADIYGPKSALCLHLAEMHSKAVDYPKTGEPAKWKSKYNPQKWPHFMEKKKSSYQTKKALGVIYDKVVKQTIQFLPDWERAFDQRVITRFELEHAILKEARKIKTQYDTAVRRILSQHNVETEFELYTAWVMSKPPIGSDYKRQEDLGREYDALKQRFRDICYEVAGGYDETKIDKFVAAMYKVTEEEIKIALFEHHRGPTNDAGIMDRFWGRYNPKKSVLAAAHRKTGTVAQPVVDQSTQAVAADTEPKDVVVQAVKPAALTNGNVPTESPAKSAAGEGVISEVQAEISVNGDGATKSGVWEKANGVHSTESQAESVESVTRETGAIELLAKLFSDD